MTFNDLERTPFVNILEKGENADNFYPIKEKFCQFAVCKCFAFGQVKRDKS